MIILAIRMPEKKRREIVVSEMQGIMRKISRKKVAVPVESGTGRANGSDSGMRTDTDARAARPRLCKIVHQGKCWQGFSGGVEVGTV